MDLPTRSLLQDRSRQTAFATREPSRNPPPALRRRSRWQEGTGFRAGVDPCAMGKECVPARWMSSTAKSISAVAAICNAGSSRITGPTTRNVKIQCAKNHRQQEKRRDSDVKTTACRNYGRIRTVNIIRAMAKTAIFQKSRRYRRPGRFKGLITWIAMARSRITANAFDIILLFCGK